MLKLCGKCGALVRYPARYCDRCQETVQAQQQERRRQYDRNRNPKHRKFYNSKAWRTLSARKLQDVGYRCEECGALATEVHHVETLAENWNRRLDYGNLKALCHRCHDQKHERFVPTPGGVVEKVERGGF